MLNAEKMYPVSFIVTRKEFCLSLRDNGANSCFFVNGKEIVKFKAKDFAIAAIPPGLRNISNNWSVIIWKKLD